MNDLADRRQEEKDRRRDEILDAAAAVAEIVDMDALTMEQVARKARLSRALIYVYFRDKDDLLLGLADRAHELLSKRFAAICSRRKTGLEKILAMGRSYVAFADEQPVYFNALACFAAHVPEADDQQSNMHRCMESGDRLHGLTIEALNAGIKDGSIRPDIGPPALTAVTLWGFMHGIIQLIATKGEVLAKKGAGSKQLVDNALSMTTRALRK